MVDSDGIRCVEVAGSSVAGAAEGSSFLFFWLSEPFLVFLDRALLFERLPLKPPLFSGGCGGSDSSILTVIVKLEGLRNN